MRKLNESHAPFSYVLCFDSLKNDVYMCVLSWCLHILSTTVDSINKDEVAERRLRSTIAQAGPKGVQKVSAKSRNSKKVFDSRLNEESVRSHFTAPECLTGSKSSQYFSLQASSVAASTHTHRMFIGFLSKLPIRKKKSYVMGFRREKVLGLSKLIWFTTTTWTTT